MAKTADIIPFISVDFIATVDGWYYGSAMGQRYELGGTSFSIKWGTRAYRDTIKWFEILSAVFPLKERTFYRLASPKKMDVKPGQIMSLKTSTNVLQSWTDKEESAVQFFKDAYSRNVSSQRSYFIVQAKLEPMTSTKVIKPLLEWMLKNEDRLPELTQDKLWKNRQMIKWISQVLKRLDSKMIQSQRESIVYVPKPIKVKVVNVLV
jgi:hypothetical protein